MDTIEILTIILLVTASALCIALIYFFYLIVKSVQAISTNVQELTHKLNPLIQTSLLLSEKITHVTNEAESQLQISKTIVSDIRDRVDKILNVENKIRIGIMPLIKNLNAVGNGLEVFWRKFTNK